MSEITRLLQSTEPHAADELLTLVYDELRRLAAQWLAHEKPGQTLEPTGLVHEAYLRIVGKNASQAWDGRGHFFAVAAEAMRRILIENARRKKRQRHGGDRRRVALESHALLDRTTTGDLLDLDEALTRLAAEDATAAAVVKLRFYAGLSIEQAALALAISRASAYRHWTYARAWLRCALKEAAGSSSS
jgi:RNA polymerase sigma factor (TIGR02999 family)